MLKKAFLELLRWSLRFHSIFHIAHIYSDIALVENINWTGVILGSYIMLIEFLSSFFIPKEHIHFKPFKADVHEEC